MSVSEFLRNNYRHFNAKALVEASESYVARINAGDKMLIALAGAMSTAEIGITLAEMIRQDKVHIISCTGANLEEDVFNLVAHDHYKRIPNYRDLTPRDELDLYRQGFNRVTDTCIPEEHAFSRIRGLLVEAWREAASRNSPKFPHEFFYQILPEIKSLPPERKANSWIAAAAEKNLPVIVPGWEDSTCGNFFAAERIKGNLPASLVKGGIDYMISLAEWYQRQQAVGFLQIGGGIAGDFPICAVPMLRQDLEKEDIPLWSYFCQVSDSTTSYGSYSGAVPNEKITWGKIDASCPTFMIESDASIVMPLFFALVLGY